MKDTEMIIEIVAAHTMVLGILVLSLSTIFRNVLLVVGWDSVINALAMVWTYVLVEQGVIVMSCSWWAGTYFQQMILFAATAAGA